MTTDVVDFGEFKFRRALEKSYAPDTCHHRKLALIDKGGLVQCEDCHAYVSPYWALVQMTLNWEMRASRHRAKQEQLDAVANKTVVLRAALQVEKAWRSRTMVPTCPHCHKGILPDDGFGCGSAVNKEMELRRRKIALEAARAQSEKREGTSE